MDEKEERKEKREKEKLRRAEAIKKLSESTVIKDIIRETTRRSKRLPKNMRPAAIRDRRMTAEEVTVDIEKEKEDIAELRKALELGAPKGV